MRPKAPSVHHMQASHLNLPIWPHMGFCFFSCPFFSPHSFVWLSLDFGCRQVFRALFPYLLAVRHSERERAEGGGGTFVDGPKLLQKWWFSFGQSSHQDAHWPFSGRTHSKQRRAHARASLDSTSLSLQWFCAHASDIMNSFCSLLLLLLLLFSCARFPRAFGCYSIDRILIISIAKRW